MSRILLVDDSPHAQRMGERILSDEGYEVVTVSNSDSALIRLDDVDPDVVLADTVMPGRTGFEICQYLKMSPRHRHVRVILTAGVLEPLDEGQVKRVEADGTLRKPFEASALLAAVKPLAEAAAAARAEAIDPGSGVKGRGQGGHGLAAIVPFVAVVDAEQVRAAVTVALDASMGTMVDEITGRVLAALNAKKSSGPAPETAPARPEPPVPAPPPAVLSLPPSRVEPVRRISPMKIRSTSILGLELDSTEQESPAASEPRVLRPVLRTEFGRQTSENRSAFPGASQAFGPRAAPDPRPVTGGLRPLSILGEPSRSGDNLPGGKTAGATPSDTPTGGAAAGATPSDTPTGGAAAGATPSDTPTGGKTAGAPPSDTPTGGAASDSQPTD
jgi:CheY-like chemotaxis protein